jgi:hypothetical protein
MNANYFQVPLKIWEQLDQKGLSWPANQKFLDRADMRGDKFIFTDNARDPIHSGSDFAKEINYMTGEKGYTLTPDGKGMFKGVNK